jgi:predicted metal-dependent peptidase
MTQTAQTSAKTFFRQAAKGKKTQHASKAIQRLVENSPGFGSLTLFAGHVDCDDGPALSWTDGTNIYYPKAFTKISLAEQIGVVAHEAMHIAFRHVQRFAQMRKHFGEIDHRLANIAADAIINQTLAGYSWLQLPGQPVMLVELLKEVLGEDWKPDDALAHWNLELLYKTIADRTPRRQSRGGQGQQGRSRQPAGQGQQPSGGNGQQPEAQDGDSNADRAERYARSKGFDADMAESPTPFDPAQEAEESRTWRNRILRAKAGDGTHGILRRPLADVPDTATPWEHILRSKLTAALMPRSRETWARPSRRWVALHEDYESLGWEMPFEPAVDPNSPAMTVAVCIDTSGSIDDDLFNRFVAELVGIQRRTGATMHVIVADMTIHDEQTVKASDGKQGLLRKVTFKGHGGTDFSPALKRCDEIGAAQIVYLTDLEGPARHKPKAPVIWAVPKRFGRRGVQAPFGTLLLID